MKMLEAKIIAYLLLKPIAIYAIAYTLIEVFIV